jgi:hypothetical protein
MTPTRCIKPEVSMTEATLVSDPVAKLGAERRVAVRYPSVLDAVCQPATPRFELLSSPARVWDISTSGIGLIVNRRFDVGTVLFMEIELGPGQFSRTLQAMVLHVCPHLDNLWMIGCELSSDLSEAELKQYLR